MNAWPMHLHDGTSGKFIYHDMAIVLMAMSYKVSGIYQDVMCCMWGPEVYSPEQKNLARRPLNAASVGYTRIVTVEETSSRSAPARPVVPRLGFLGSSHICGDRAGVTRMKG